MFRGLPTVAFFLSVTCVMGATTVALANDTTPPTCPASAIANETIFMEVDYQVRAGYLSQGNIEDMCVTQWTASTPPAPRGSPTRLFRIVHRGISSRCSRPLTSVSA